ncbi:MAG: class I mannose-6-phosphate isomerase [Ruminococcaceae bacterium]|nr:class I mannose-6-phosphate isomerase [Oscillospiraceae bacterium]
MQPLKLTPAFKDYLWGGTRLRTDFRFETELSPVAEAWVLSCHRDGHSVIAEGTDAGMTLADWIVREGRGVLGKNAAALPDFPILIKLIDAEKPLSLQVHPDDAYARANGEGYGKTELWYVLDAAPGATLYYGLTRDVSREELAARITDNSLLSVVNAVPVKAGDCFYVKAGTIHGIGAGILIAEIQQSSNATYRVYDYGRLGADGKPRPLHLQQALDVLTTTAVDPAGMARPVFTEREGYATARLARNDYFTIDALRIAVSATLTAGEESFHALLCTAGAGTLRWGEQSLTYKKGDALFLPAGLGKYTLFGECEMLLTHV